MLVAASMLSACESGYVSGLTVGGAGLSWIAPSAREDGSPLALSKIKGYRVYFSVTEGVYNTTNSVFIYGGGTMQAFLPAGVQDDGTYYTVMTALDTEGRESRYLSSALTIA